MSQDKMRALVISDTHVKRIEDIEKLKSILDPFLEGVDVIIHAGDSVTKELIVFLKSKKPTHIVSGNMDYSDIQHLFPESTVFTFGRFRIGLTHGWGPATGLKDRVFDRFKDSRVDAIIFGHSHQPYIGSKNGILLLNPGSPTDTRFADRNTVAILEANDELSARIVEIDRSL